MLRNAANRPRAWDGFGTGRRRRGPCPVSEHRFADGHPERFQHIATDLVRQKIDVMIGLGGDIAAALKKATSKIPIVVGTSGDPVRASLISSLARRGGNITGVTFVMDELAGKRVQLLKEISPKLSRVDVLWNPAHADSEFNREAVGVRLSY